MNHAFVFLRPKNPQPARPRPRSSRVAGSGTWLVIVASVTFHVVPSHQICFRLERKTEFILGGRVELISSDSENRCQEESILGVKTGACDCEKTQYVAKIEKFPVPLMIVPRSMGNSIDPPTQSTERVPARVLKAY